MAVDAAGSRDRLPVNQLGATRMEFGIGIPTSGESWKVAQRAEELGFTHAWFYDTQMLVGDPFVAMGAAALKTSRIRLGTGVLVPTNRIPVVTASAFATLNAMAPGRIDFGVGTGFSARRAMGLGAMKLADMEEYIRVVYALLNGETTEAEVDPGVRKKIRFLNPGMGLINIKDPIRLHISALGPKGRQMTARHGAAWKTVMSGVDDGLAALNGMQRTSPIAGGRGATCIPPPGSGDVCCRTARRWTARGCGLRRVRAPRCCCIAPRMWTWKAG
jgi:5,10-methylenetetrahydromethanopterin reductase